MGSSGGGNIPALPLSDMLLLLLLFGLSVQTSIGAEAARGIRAFSSDGCSLFPDGWIKQKNLWCECCYQHDIAYWQGGSQEQRREADSTLAACVKQRTGSNALAQMMEAGVRFGGHPIFPNWYRWGYGWPYGRGYQSLTSHEQSDVAIKLVEYQNRAPAYVCSVEPPE